MSVPLVAGLGPSLSVARGIAGAYPRLQKRRFARTVAHLAEAFPAWPREHVEETARRCYAHLFQLGVELLFAPRLLTEEGHARHLVFTHIRPSLVELLANKPIVLITGHCGNWELIGYSIAMLGFPMYAVYRPLDLKPLDDWVRETRERRGLELVSKFGAVKALPPLVRAGHPAGLVADQSGGDRGLFVPYFGRLTSTYKSIGILAMQTGATMVCGMARRLGDDETPPPGPWQSAGPGGRQFVGAQRSAIRYAVEITDIFGPDDWQAQPDPLFYLTARYRRAIEAMVRRAPEQYLWMHRIWRARPAHERQNKPFPPALREKLRALPWMSEADVDAVVARSDRDAACLARGETPPAA